METKSHLQVSSIDADTVDQTGKVLESEQFTAEIQLAQLEAEAELREKNARPDDLFVDEMTENLPIPKLLQLGGGSNIQEM